MTRRQIHPASATPCRHPRPHPRTRWRPARSVMPRPEHRAFGGGGLVGADEKVAVALEVDPSLKVRAQIVVPLWILRPAALRGDHHDVWSIVQVEQRSGVPAGRVHSGGAGRRRPSCAGWPGRRGADRRGVGGAKRPGRGAEGGEGPDGEAAGVVEDGQEQVLGARKSPRPGPAPRSSPPAARPVPKTAACYLRSVT